MELCAAGSICEYCLLKGGWEASAGYGPYGKTENILWVWERNNICVEGWVEGRKTPWKSEPTVLFSCFILQTLALSYMSGTISRFVFGSSSPPYTKAAHCDNDALHPVIFYVSLLITICIFYSYYDTKAVFLAMGITAVVCIAVTIFCFQTKVDGDVNCVSL